VYKKVSSYDHLLKMKFKFVLLFRRILANQPPMPRTLSKQGQDLIIRLLSKDPHKRLGGGEAGFEEIKRHAMFQVGLISIHYNFYSKYIWHKFNLQIFYLFPLKVFVSVFIKETTLLFRI